MYTKSFGLFLILTATIAFSTTILCLTTVILLIKKKLIKIKSCKININQDPSLTKTISSGETFLSALTNSGIPIPSPCGGKATCKQCKIKFSSPLEPIFDTEKSFFSKKQLNEGWRLACQHKISGDVSIEICPQLLFVKQWQGRVISNNNVASFIKELVIEVSNDEFIPYKPGGYLQIYIPPFKTNTSNWKTYMDSKYFSDWDHFKLFDIEIDFSKIKKHSLMRAYSLASYPEEGSIIKFNVRIATPPLVNNKVQTDVPWGICSSYIFSLCPGDEVSMTGPYGESFMKENDLSLVFLIGGAGSSFGRSHVMDLLKTKQTKRKIDFWYGARSLKENIYEEEYKELEKQYDNFSYHLVLSSPLQEDLNNGWDANDPIKTNLLFKAFEIGQLSSMESPEESLYYVCGPPLHNQSVLKLLDSYGVEREHIILDDFGN